VLDLQLSATQLPADGHGSAQLRVSARDVHGNPVRGARLSARARGALTALVERAPGVYEAEYRAPLGQPGQDRILVRDAVSGRQAEALLALSGRGGRVSLAARAGYLVNFARVSGPLLALELGYRLSWLSEQLSLALWAGYYQSSTSVPAADGGLPLASKLWAFPLLVRAAYNIPVGALDVWPQLGAGVLAASSSVSSADTGKVEERHAVPLFTAGLGAALGLGPGRLGIELGYLLASLHGDSVQGNAGGAYIALGYELRL